MNYQFRRNQYGTPLAEFDMGCEMFALWFNEELGTDKEKLNEVRMAITQLQASKMQEFTLVGAEISLFLDADEVEVRSSILELDGPEQLPEGTELYDQESMAGCGLEDFIQVLESWAEYVA